MRWGLKHVSTKAKTQVTTPPTPAAATNKVGGQSLFDSQETQTEADDAWEYSDHAIAASSDDPPESQLQRAEQQGHHFEQITVATHTPAIPLQRLIQRQLLEGVKERWEDGAVSLKPQADFSLAAQVSPADEKWEDGAVTLKAESTSVNNSVIQAQNKDGSFAAGAQIESRLQSSKGGGQPLADGTRNFMESRFGNDFSSVRVHTNAESVQMNQSLQAQAFTHGNDIYFNSGKYNPESTGGKRLLAHELTHTIQQTGPSALSPKHLNKKATKTNKHPTDQTTQIPLGQATDQVQPQRISQVAARPVGALEEVTVTVQPQLTIGAVNDPYEQEADRIADQVVTTPIVQRSPDPLVAPRNFASPHIARAIESTTQTQSRNFASPHIGHAGQTFGSPPPIQRNKKKDIKDDVNDAIKGIKAEVNSKTTPESEDTEANKGAQAGQDLADDAKRQLGNADNEDKAKKAAKKLKKKAKKKSKQVREDADQTQEAEAQKEVTDTAKTEEDAIAEAKKQDKESEEADPTADEATAAPHEGEGAEGSAEAGEDTGALDPIGVPERLPDPGAIPAPTVDQPKAPTSPDNDPAFAAVVSQSEHVAAEQSTHKPATDKAREAQDAAIDPAQQHRRAQATQANEAGAKEPQLFDREAFITALLSVLESNKPKSQKDVEQGKGMDGASEQMTEEINKAKEGSGGELTASATRDPDAAAEAPKDVIATPLAEDEAGEQPRMS